MPNRKKSYTWRSKRMRQACPARSLILSLGVILYLSSEEVQLAKRQMLICLVVDYERFSRWRIRLRRPSMGLQTLNIEAPSHRHELCININIRKYLWVYAFHVLIAQMQPHTSAATGVAPSFLYSQPALINQNMAISGVVSRAKTPPNINLNT